MKYLLVLAVLLLAFWNWRNNRQDSQQNATRRAPPSRGPARLPVPMIACTHCGTHLPEDEAVSGAHGRYCCQEHRRQHEAVSR